MAPQNLPDRRSGRILILIPVAVVTSSRKLTQEVQSTADKLSLLKVFFLLLFRETLESKETDNCLLDWRYGS